jgi:hypothetical protein
MRMDARGVQKKVDRGLGLVAPVLLVPLGAFFIQDGTEGSPLILRSRSRFGPYPLFAFKRILPTIIHAVLLDSGTVKQLLSVVVLPTAMAAATVVVIGVPLSLLPNTSLATAGGRSVEI